MVIIQILVVLSAVFVGWFGAKMVYTNKLYKAHLKTGKLIEEIESIDEEVIKTFKLEYIRARLVMMEELKDGNNTQMENESYVLSSKTIDIINDVFNEHTKLKSHYDEFRDKIVNDPNIKKEVEKLATKMGYDIKIKK